MKSGTKSMLTSFSSGRYPISTRFLVAWRLTFSTTIWMNTTMLPVFQSALPMAERTLAMSSSWFTSVSSRCPCLEMASSSTHGAPAFAFSSCALPRMTVRGVRNSWVTFVKNSCLARLAFLMTFCILAFTLSA